jgi:NADPH2:quinone reductase
MHGMVAVPQEMTFIAHGAGGGPEVLVPARGPVPQPRADEVLMRTLAVGVNRPDVAQRGGTYPAPPGASPILGLECAGEVAAVGADVTRYRVGDKVTALTNGGAYAEYCTAPEPQTLPWPAGYDALRAAALPETYFTVWANMFGHGRLSADETVLVHGGTSGIGVTAIQLAKAFGATVYATAGSAQKVAACRDLGADAAIDYRAQDFVEEVKRLTGGKGVDVVLDMVGGDYIQRDIDCMAPDGRHVSIAFLNGPKVTLNMMPVMLKRLTLTGSTLRARPVPEKGRIAHALYENVWPLLESGAVKPLIHQTFPLAEAAAAHALMESSSHIGKIMLTITP